MNELVILYAIMALLVVGVLGVVALFAFVSTVVVVRAYVWLAIAGFIEFVRMMLGWVLHG